MKRDEIVAKLQAERTGNRVWDEMSKWERASILAELGEICDAIERAGLCIIPAVADEQEIERMARKICPYAFELKHEHPDDCPSCLSVVKHMMGVARAAAAAVREQGEQNTPRGRANSPSSAGTSAIGTGRPTDGAAVREGGKP